MSFDPTYQYETDVNGNIHFDCNPEYYLLNLPTSENNTLLRYYFNNVLKEQEHLDLVVKQKYNKAKQQEPQQVGMGVKDQSVAPSTRVTSIAPPRPIPPFSFGI